MPNVLVREIALSCPVDHAFVVFTEKIDLWWPRGHRRNSEAALSLTREALIEQAADGTQWTMGRVTAFEPPHHLALDWLPGSPNAPTTVDVQFAASGEGTVITVRHRALTPEAETIWPQRVALFTKGWETVLPALQTFIEEEE